MKPANDASAKSNRGPLYVIGGILLVLVLVGYWFKDDLGSMFQSTPDASSLAGSWVFDGPRAKEILTQAYGSEQQYPGMEKAYGKAVYTFAADSITVDNGSGKAQPVPCKIQGYPPNAYLITIGEGKTQRELVFQLEKANGAERLYLSTEGNMVPLKRQ